MDPGPAPKPCKLQLGFQVNKTFHAPSFRIAMPNRNHASVDKFRLLTGLYFSCDSVGVESAGLGGQDKSQIEVVGDGVDAVELTNCLRKKVGYAELASVEAVGEKKEEPAVQPVAWPGYVGGMPQTYIYPIHPHQDPSCSIM